MYTILNFKLHTAQCSPNTAPWVMHCILYTEVRTLHTAYRKLNPKQCTWHNPLFVVFRTTQPKNFRCPSTKQNKQFLLIIFNSSIFHHPKLNCKANFHTKYQIKLQAVTNHMIYIKPYMRKAHEIRTFPKMTSCVTGESTHEYLEVT